MKHHHDRRDALGFRDEGLNFVANGQSVKESSVPIDSVIWGEVFVDPAGLTNFKFHVEGGQGISFDQAKRALEAFVRVIQQRIDTADQCPYYR
jgi:hypothetical protein